MSWGLGEGQELPYRSLVTGFALVVYIFHSYLDVRQYKALKLPRPPKVIQATYDEKEYRKTQHYQLDKWWFGSWKGLFDTALKVALILTNFYAACWALSTRGLRRLLGSEPEIPVTLLYFVLSALCQLALEVPFQLYATFVVEQRHGFNKQTLALFFRDLATSVALGSLLLPVIAVFTYTLQHTGPYAPLYLWLVALVVQVVVLAIYPTIQAFFNKFSPLPASELREQIEALAKSLAFPLRKLYVVDGSKRSAHSNAYMYGFFKNKRIVLFDTLIQQCTEQQVVAVLAHELGHWKLNHVMKNFITSQIQLLACFSLFTAVRNSRGLPQAFGFAGDHAPAFIAFELFQLISAPLDELLGLGANVLSRRFEYEADAFAVRLGRREDLRAALLKLSRENRDASNVDAWFSAYHYSHPPLVERLRAIEAEQPEEKKAQ